MGVREGKRGFPLASSTLHGPAPLSPTLHKCSVVRGVLVGSVLQAAGVCVCVGG